MRGSSGALEALSAARSMAEQLEAAAARSGRLREEDADLTFGSSASSGGVEYRQYKKTAAELSVQQPPPPQSLSTNRCSVCVKSGLQGGLNVAFPADASTLSVSNDTSLKPVPK